MIITVNDLGSERLILIKDGSPLGRVVEINTVQKSYKRVSEAGLIETGIYDRLLLSLETEREVADALSLAKKRVVGGNSLYE